MLDNLSPGFSAEYLIRAGENYDFRDRDKQTMFAPVSMYSFLKKIEKDSPEEVDVCMAVWYQACAENTIFVGEKASVLTAFIFGLDNCLFLSYDLDNKDTKWEAPEDYQPMGKMTVFAMGQFKENGQIRRFVHADPERCAYIFNQIIEQSDQENDVASRVFSFANWKLIYGNYPFNQSLLEKLEGCDGETIVPAGNSITGNPQFMLSSMAPMTTFGLIATREESGNDLARDDFGPDAEITSLLFSSFRDITLPIPFSFQTPALLVYEDAIAFAMVSPSEEDQRFYTIQSDPQFPLSEFVLNLSEEFEKDRRYFANGLVDSDIKTQVYMLNIEQFHRYTDAVLAPWHRNDRNRVNRSNAMKYFSLLDGYYDQDEYDRVKKLYEQQCLSILMAVGNERFVLQQEAIEMEREAERQRRAEEERRIEENRRREEALRQQREAEEKKRREEEIRRQQQTLKLISTFHTKLVGVTYSNTGTNTESRQWIIRELLRKGLLDRGQELRMVKEPTNPYDNHAVAVFGPDGRQLGYLAKEIARPIFDGMNCGNAYKIYVSDVTGGGAGVSYGVNVRIEIYSNQSADLVQTPSTYQPKSTGYSYGMGYDDYEDIYSVARGYGFSIDDDGNWVPRSDDEFY